MTIYSVQYLRGSQDRKQRGLLFFRMTFTLFSDFKREIFSCAFFLTSPSKFFYLSSSFDINFHPNPGKSHTPSVAAIMLHKKPLKN